MLRFSVLASGSKANCTYIESEHARILIDCGLSARRTVERLHRIGVDPSTLNAILVTHEHFDHVMGVSMMNKRFGTPIIATRGTARHLPTQLGIQRCTPGVQLIIEDLQIEPFSISHDAAQPVGFRVQCGALVYAQATDLGIVTPEVREGLRGAHTVLLESNHDLDMLWGCDYPWDIKQRIASPQGHLSNSAARELLNEVRHDDLSHLVLGHVSENSNTPQLALRSAQDASLGSRVTLRCANPYEETPLIAVAA